MLVTYAKRLKKYVIDRSFERSKRFNVMYNVDISFTKVRETFESANDQYLYFHHYFWNMAPEWLRAHRAYFRSDNRGFGEDAFHAMWYLLFKEFRPAKVLEIGIYRGQVISLWALLAKHLSYSVEINGISPFNSAGDKVSDYTDNIDYYTDVIRNFEYFGLLQPILHKGFSTDQAMVETISSNCWSLIYIDGNHDYDVAKHDFALCASSLDESGIIVLDDASLDTDYKPPFFATAGHPGPSQVARNMDRSRFEELSSVGHNRVFRKL
jgi:hypothetical protein